MKPFFWMLLGLVFLVLVRDGLGDEVISSFSGGVLGQAAVDGTEGFAFHVGASSRTVTQLGVWDFLDDGLAESHDVGLWDDAGNLLASVTIPSGTSAALVNGFRYEPINPIVLSPGATYVLGAYYVDLTLDFVRLQTTATLAPDFTFGETRFHAGASLAFPSDAEPPGDDGFFGPNALLAVPETLPGWCILPVITLLVLAAPKRKRTL